MIFLGITGAFAGAVTYDRREKKKVQKKWCDLVSHLAQDPLPINQTPRKLTIFLAAPPGDGLRPTRDYFRQYIKPILVAAAIDYDVIEGRREGDVRYGTAEQIRRQRRKAGEQEQNPTAEPPDPEQIVEMQRMRMGVQEEPGPKGDLVIGRHTWKEYIRGIHEGWLGPLEKTVPPSKAEVSSDPPTTEADKSSTDESQHSSTSSTEEAAKSDKEKENSPTESDEEAIDPRASYLSTSAYPSATLAPSTPPIFEASGVIQQPHLLGFLNTPIRIYRYLNQRVLADKVGRETAAVVLGLSVPYDQTSTTSTLETNSLDNSAVSPQALEAEPSSEGRPSNWEQQHMLEQEETEWHKSVRKPRNDNFERTWLDDVVMDSRIASRMRKFMLDPVENDRAERIANGLEKPLGHHEKEEDLKIKVGNLDDPTA